MSNKTYDLRHIPIIDRIKDKLGIAPLVYETTYQLNGKELPKPEGLFCLATSRVDPHAGLTALLDLVGAVPIKPTGDDWVIDGRDAAEYVCQDGSTVMITTQDIGKSIENYGRTAAHVRIRHYGPQVPLWICDLMNATGEAVLPHHAVYTVKELQECEGIVNVRPDKLENGEMGSGLLGSLSFAAAAIKKFNSERYRATGRFTYERDVSANLVFRIDE